MEQSNIYDIHRDMTFMYTTIWHICTCSYCHHIKLSMGHVYIFINLNFLNFFIIHNCLSNIFITQNYLSNLYISSYNTILTTYNIITWDIISETLVPLSNVSQTLSKLWSSTSKEYILIGLFVRYLIFFQQSVMASNCIVWHWVSMTKFCVGLKGVGLKGVGLKVGGFEGGEFDEGRVHLKTSDISWHRLD